MVYVANSIAGGASGLMNQCFVAGTEVATDDGLKNIEDIEEGDVVWSCNPDTGETGLKSVKQVFVNETDELVHVTITNDSGVSETIDTTVCHPFYVVDYGFKYASELKIGDSVKSVDGDIYEVSNVDSEKLAKPVKVYNFEVEDWHTYFVSEGEILVHNMCAKKSDATITSKKKNKESGIPVKETTKASNGLLYKSNPKHTFGQNGNSTKAGIEPSNSLDLFGKSVVSPDNPGQRYSYDKITKTLHRFSNDGNGIWHWSGSTNQGKNSLKSNDVPNAIKKMFKMKKKGW